ncbi:hypothetical protein GLOIN_2v1848653 [Rhizophagus irregularis DAOM 181602=DAOM 197198]|nr:hypothetical protein GLOIN_2v1848653 [Rhizophagus irregularis DAOM 181602=DAOM 197198]
MSKTKDKCKNCADFDANQASRDIEGNSNKKHVRESDDDQVEILEISDTNNTNEDFCSTLKNDKKRVKIGNTSICKKVTKPGIV